MSTENMCTGASEPHANKDVNEVFNNLWAKLRVMSESEAETAAPSFKVDGSEVVLFLERPHSDSVGMYIRRPGHATIRAFFFPDTTSIELEVTIGSKLKMLRVPMQRSVLELMRELVDRSISAVTAYNRQHQVEAAAEPKPPLSSHEFMAALHTVFAKHEIVNRRGMCATVSHMYVDGHPPCVDIFFGFEINGRRLGSDFMLRGSRYEYVLDSRDSHNHRLLTFDRPTEARDVVKHAIDILEAIAKLESRVSGTAEEYTVRRTGSATAAAEPNPGTNSFIGMWQALTDMVPSHVEYHAKAQKVGSGALAVYIINKGEGTLTRCITVSSPTCHAYIALPHEAVDQVYRQMRGLHLTSAKRKTPQVSLTFFKSPLPQDNDIDAYRSRKTPEQIKYDITSFASARDALRAILGDFVKLQRKVQAGKAEAAAEPPVAPGGLRNLFHSVVAMLLAKKHIETDSASIEFSRGSMTSNRELTVTVVLKHKPIPVKCRYYALTGSPDQPPVAIQVRSMNPGYLYDGQWFHRGAAIRPLIATIESATTASGIAKSILEAVVRDATKRKITPADAMYNLVERAMSLPGNELETQTAAFTVQTLNETAIQLKTVAGVMVKTHAYTEVYNDQLFVHFGEQKREITKVLPTQELADEIEHVARELTGIKAPSAAHAAAEPAPNTTFTDVWLRFYEWVGRRGRVVGRVRLRQDRKIEDPVFDRIIATRDGVDDIFWSVTDMQGRGFVHVVKISTQPAVSKTHERIPLSTDFREIAKRVVAFVAVDDLEMEPVGPEPVYIAYVKERLADPTVSAAGLQFKLEPEYKHSEPTDTVLIVRDATNNVIGRLHKARNPIRIILEAYTGKGLKVVDHLRPLRTPEFVDWLGKGLVQIAKSRARREKGKA